MVASDPACDGRRTDEPALNSENRYHADTAAPIQSARDAEGGAS